MERERDEDENTAAELNQEPGKTESQAEDHTVGGFGGGEDQVVRTRHGEPIASDTGDQGGGQS